MSSHSWNVAVQPERFARSGSTAARSVPPAAREFSADSLWEARGPAKAVLAAAPWCTRCRDALAGIRARAGFDFFVDDDPRVVMQALAPRDRNPCTLQLLAALIVLEGGERGDP